MNCKSIPIPPNLPAEWSGGRFIQSLNHSTIYVQDMYHIVTKARNVLLKPSVFLPLANFVASSTHLSIMINEKANEGHGLTKSDINSAAK